MPYVYPTSFADSGSDSPGSGLTWDVVLGQTTIASSAASNGWVVSYSSGKFTVTVPAASIDAPNYEVRLDTGSGDLSATFDVVPQITAGGSATITLPAGDTCATGSWDIVRYGTTIATSASPNGWSKFTPSLANPHKVLIKAPFGAPVGRDYEIRLNDGYSGLFDVGFSVPTNIHPGTSQGVLDDPMTLPSWMEDLVPTDESDAPGGASATGSGGPSSAISVDLVHGVTSVDGGPDLIVNNPTGEDVVFERRYRSVMAAGNLSSPGLPAGWTHNWDFRVVALSANSWGGMELVYPNGASEVLTPVLDGNGYPTGAFSGPAGAPYVATGSPSASGYAWDSITLTYNGLAKDIFAMPQGDSVMRLVQQVSGNSQPINLTYTSGVLTQIDNAVNGGAASMQVNIGVNAGAITSITDVIANRIRSYTYSAGELSSVSQINSASLEWGFQYTTISGQPYINVVQSLDPQGVNRSATISYDTSTGRAQSQTDAKGTVRAYDFIFGQGGGSTISTASGTEDRYSVTADQNNRVTSTTTAAGDTTTFSYGGSDPSVITSIARPMGNPIVVQTDSHGKPSQITYPYGNYTKITWEYPAEAPLGRIAQVQEFSNDGHSKQPVVYAYYGSNDPDGILGFTKEIDWAYGGYVKYTYTTLGNVATVSGPTTQVTYDYTTKYGGITVPERLGMPYSVKDLVHPKTWFDYDAAGNVVWTRDPMGIESSVATNQYDQVTQINLPLNHTVQLAYAIGGKSPTSAMLSATKQTTLFQNTYDNEGAGHTSTDANNTTNTSSLDGQFGLSSLGNGNGVAMHSFFPKPFDRAFQTSIGVGARSLNFTSYFDSNGSLASSSPTPNMASNGISATVQPNAADSLRDLPSGVDVTLNSVVRGTGYADTQYSYDGYGRVRQDGIAALQTPIPQDPNRHPQIPTSIASQAGNTYTYDDLDRIVSEGSVAYTYNPDGTRHTMVVTLPATTPYIYLYSYDNALRLIEIDVTPSNGNAAIAKVKYAYDNDDRVLSVRSSKATTLYTYNDLGQLTSLLNLSPDNTYDLYGDGIHVYTEPDSGIHHSITSAFTNISYDDLGNRTEMDFVAQRTEGKAYPPTPSTFGAGHVHFGYDDGGRLIQEIWSGDFGPTKTLNHSYDAAGNLTQLRNHSWSGDSNSDQATNSSLPGYDWTQFNDNGEVCTTAGDSATQQGGQVTNQFYYHADGQLAFFDGDDGPLAFIPGSRHQERYKYDALGRRFERSLEGQAGFDVRDDKFAYDGSMLVARETYVDINEWGFVWVATDLPYPYPFSAADFRNLYVWGPTGLALEFDGLGNTRAFTFDPQGNCIATAGPVSQYSSADYVIQYPIFYDGYGNQVWPYSPDLGDQNYSYYANERILEQPFQYKGQFGYYTDESTGLYYCLNRYYDPNSGRWMSRDPVGLEGGVNVYQYCHGNPVMIADPSGLQGVGQGQTNFNFLRWLAHASGIDTAADNDMFFYRMAKNAPRGNIASGMIRLAFNRGDQGMMWDGVIDLVTGFALDGLGAMGGEEVEFANAARGLSFGLEQGDEAVSIGKAAWRVASERGNIPDTMVLGRYPGYLKLGEELGAKTFSMGRFWTEEMGWAADQVALDRAIARHTKIVFSHSYYSFDYGGTFKREVEYLKLNGYQVTQDGWGMYWAK